MAIRPSKLVASPRVDPTDEAPAQPAAKAAKHRMFFLAKLAGSTDDTYGVTVTKRDGTKATVTHKLADIPEGHVPMLLSLACYTACTSAANAFETEDDKVAAYDDTWQSIVDGIWTYGRSGNDNDRVVALMNIINRQRGEGREFSRYEFLKAFATKTEAEQKALLSRDDVYLGAAALKDAREAKRREAAAQRLASSSEAAIDF